METQQIYSHQFQTLPNTLTAALKPPSVPGAPAAKSGLYTVLLSVVSAGDRPASQAIVVLNSVSSKNKQQAKTNSSGQVQFMNLQQGIYDVAVMANNKKVGESIINVSGTNHTLTFSISLNVQKNNPLFKNANAFTTPIYLVWILVIGIILGVGIALLIVKFVRRKRNH